MILLENKANSVAPGGDYDYGRMQDRASGVQGSEMNTEFHGDASQFFERIMALSGITANGLPDNNTNGFQLVDAIIRVIRPYKVYNALISQTGTSVPTVQILGDNQIGTIIWTRTAAGTYRGTLSGAFDNLKTWFYLADLGVTNSAFTRLNNNEVQLLIVNDSSTPIDGELNQTSMEIRVYY